MRLILSHFYCLGVKLYYLGFTLLHFIHVGTKQMFLQIVYKEDGRLNAKPKTSTHLHPFSRDRLTSTFDDHFPSPMAGRHHVTPSWIPTTIKLPLSVTIHLLDDFNFLVFRQLLDILGADPYSLRSDPSSSSLSLVDSKSRLKKPFHYLDSSP